MKKLLPKKPKIQKTYNKKENGGSRTWLDDRADRIWELHKAKMKPAQISSILNKDAKLKKDQGCTNKEVSDWLRYRKKTGHSTLPVSLSNNNLRAETSDSWYDAAKGVANNYGRKLEDDGYDGYDDSIDQEDRWYEGFEDGCRSSLRFFTHADDKTFSIFCESGLEREWRAEIAGEDSVSLTITIPIPPDELVKAAGYQAVQVHLEETEEIFNIEAPRRFANDPKERKIHYPSSEFPFWTIFQYDLEVMKEEAPMEAKIDFLSKLHQANAVKKS